MYTYDQALFHERWIGPPGVPRCNLRLLHAEGGAWVTWTQVLESFWRAQQSRDWFLNHPILSDPDLCQNLLCAECFFVVSFVILSEHVCSIAHKDVDLSLVFPILCHGDDAESHRRRSFTVTSWDFTTGQHGALEYGTSQGRLSFAKGWRMANYQVKMVS